MDQRKCSELAKEQRKCSVQDAELAKEQSKSSEQASQRPKDQRKNSEAERAIQQLSRDQLVHAIAD